MSGSEFDKSENTEPDAETLPTPQFPRSPLGYSRAAVHSYVETLTARLEARKREQSALSPEPVQARLTARLDAVRAQLERIPALPHSIEKPARAEEALENARTSAEHMLAEARTHAEELRAMADQVMADAARLGEELTERAQHAAEEISALKRLSTPLRHAHARMVAKRLAETSAHTPETPSDLPEPSADPEPAADALPAPVVSQEVSPPQKATGTARKAPAKKAPAKKASGTAKKPPAKKAPARKAPAKKPATGANTPSTPVNAQTAAGSPAQDEPAPQTPPAS